jgi:hypothetical protein
MQDVDNKIHELPDVTPAPDTKEPITEPDSEAANEDEEKQEKPAESSEQEAEAETDEYGTPVPKQEKVYTESQVQAMIRDRLSRGQHAQQQAPQQQAEQPKVQDFQYDENSSQSWEQQLEQFMDGWASKREQKLQQQQWQQAEQQKQAQFESKFSNGMSKYSDFRDVVGSQPIDDAMMIATRDMKDPAAFLYAAAKNHAAELQRIAQLQDPYTKIAEIGRLDERMKKQREMKSNAPKPGSVTKGDSTSQRQPNSLDDRLRQYEDKLRKDRVR